MEKIVTILTQIGAFTGFVAFVFKAYEFWRDRRPSLRISTSFTSDPNRGSTILILNSSKVGTTINYYTLEALPPSWLRRRGWWRRFPEGHDHVEFTLEAEHVKIEVPGYGQGMIKFSEADHFQWGVKRTDDLYLRVWTSTREAPFSFLVARAGGS
ncbi:MAG: hypothetical protein Q8M19_15835 [Reyranella sp.]|uniref:hypothetical protein n=1 Tax=Reyranella sp. TaxID=1929291 RepID=UPI00122A0A2A|nr:hypothetical protein [Reyranella sp.]MDP2332157.1 hypothetical protein [Reyranella sp.]TAJ41403.1 MAG: hypothetical protein EPO55_05570 [Reyranella sp.]